MNIIYQFNEKYAPYAGVSITSLFANNLDVVDINVYVLTEGLTEDSKSKLEGLAKRYNRKIIFPDTNHLLKEFKNIGMLPYRGTYSVYLRLFFSSFIDSCERVIYLDADTIVVGSLKHLEDFDLCGKCIGMVLESIREDYKTLIGLGENCDYYNSGMILFDVNRWIEQNYEERIINHAKSVRSSYIGDQDFINIVCENDIYRLPLEYNFQPIHMRYSVSDYFKVYGENGYYQSFEILNARERPIIYHCYRWLGEFPWNDKSLHPFEEVFDEYLLQSPWYDYKKTKARIGILIFMERILYCILPKRIFLEMFRLSHEKSLKRAEKDARKHKVNKSS